MCTSSEAPALNSPRRHVTALLLRLRRFINRSVAAILARQEQQALRSMLRKLVERDAALRRDRAGIRTAVALAFGVAGSLLGSVVIASATLGDHRQAQLEVRSYRDIGSDDAFVRGNPAEPKPKGCRGNPGNAKKGCIGTICF